MNVIVVTGLGKHKRKKRAMRKGKPTTMIPTHAPKACKRSSVGKRLRLHANEESGVKKKDMCRRGNERGLKSGLCAALVTAEEGQGGGLKAAVCSLLSLVRLHPLPRLEQHKRVVAQYSVLFVLFF